MWRDRRTHKPCFVEKGLFFIFSLGGNPHENEREDKVGGRERQSEKERERHVCVRASPATH